MVKTTTTINLKTLVRSELGWFAAALLGGATLGLVSGHFLLLTLLFSVGYASWLLLRIANIVEWLSNGGIASQAPPTLGMMDHVVALVHRDKSESKRQTKSYQTTLARYNSLAAKLPDATVIFDEHKQISWCNNAALSLLNIHQERDIGQRIDNLLRAPDFQAFLSSHDYGIEFEATSMVDPEVSLSLIKVTAGHGMTVLIARDITQRVRVRQMRRAFVADVSHELRTPLTVIQGYLETLLDDKKLESGLRQRLESVSEQSNRMHHIVQHLLELSKLEGNPLHEAEGDQILIAPMLRTITEAQQASTGKEHRFALELDEQLSLLGSESELYSACTNLIANAVNYTAPGTMIRIHWHLNDENNPEICVEDNGQGIEAHHLGRLSERFYRVDKARSRSAGGTGLGLAIVKHVAQRHGGQLLIDSQTGLGSSFKIVLPHVRVASTAKVMNM